MTDVSLRFADALEQVRRAPAIVQLWAATKAFAAHYGYSHLAVADAARLAGGATNAVIYTDAPQVPGAIDRLYDYAQAPFVLRALRSPDPFLISELRDDPKTRGPWTEALADILKRGEGLIVPVYDGDEPLAGLVFGGEKPDISALTSAMLQVLSHAAFDLYRALQKGLDAATPHGLTAREVQCLRYAAGGKTDSEIGADLGISSRTVRFHLDGAMRKMNSNSRVQAIARALQERIIAV